MSTERNSADLSDDDKKVVSRLAEVEPLYARYLKVSGVTDAARQILAKASPQSQSTGCSFVPAASESSR